MITERLGPRVATTSAKPMRRRSRQERRCEIGSLIIEPATRPATREPARITIQENLATGEAQSFVSTPSMVRLLSPRRLAAFLSPCQTALRREQRQRHSRFLFRFWLFRLFSFPVGSSLPFCHNTLPYSDHPGSKISPTIIWERFQILLANLKSSK